MDAATTVQRRLTAQINDRVIPCPHAALYGSLARGEAGPQSYIGVLVVRPEGLSASDEETWDTQLAQTEAMMHARTGNDLSWLGTTATDLRRAQAGDEPIFGSWRDDAILLTGLPLSQPLLVTRTTGSTFISDTDRVRALRAAATLVRGATDRTLTAAPREEHP